MSNQKDWKKPEGGVDEVAFCNSFYMKHYLAYRDGAFFGPQGRIADENELRRMIFQELATHCTTNLARRVESILNTLRLMCPSDGLEEDLHESLFRVPVANGVYDMLNGFIPMLHMTRYRLPVAYREDAPQPERWLTFLSELLEQEDIPTLQEYMGYCLVPNTLAQKMLIIVGKGGEGKSRIGVVMKALLGDNLNQGSIAKVEASPFARADLEHLLVLVDDDLRMEGLKSTAYLKSIITSEIPMDLERKGIQSYQGKLNVRFLAFGNECLQALHDHSNGFFRRQLILRAKERPADRKDDPYLAMALLEEKEGILKWCIEGLTRLILHEYRFTMSKGARKNLQESMLRGNNIPEFLRSQGYIRPDPQGKISSRELYEIYKDWCTDNAMPAMGPKFFWDHLSQNQTAYHLVPTRTVPIGNEKYARGFLGLRACSRF